MKYSLIILDEVYNELNESALYYEELQLSLGVALVDEFESALTKIHVNPEGYEKKYKNFRQAMLNRFPYLVLFEIDGKHIVIYRFINARRHPQKRYTKSNK
jgi:hypothetical protein